MSNVAQGCRARFKNNERMVPMKNSELLRAFEMRLEGKTFNEIGRKLHYDVSAIERSLIKAVKNEGKWNRTLRKIVFPTIVDYMIEHELTVTRLYNTAYGKAGSPPWWFYAQLYGECSVTDRVSDRLTQLMQMPYKEIFRRDEENDG